MNSAIIKKEDLENIFDNQLYIIEKLKKTSGGITSLNQQSSDKFKQAKENFDAACRNIVKIRKDMEFMQKTIAKIKYLKSQMVVVGDSEGDNTINNNPPPLTTETTSSSE